MKNTKLKITLMISCVVIALVALWFMGYSERKRNHKVAEKINRMSLLEVDHIVLAPKFLSNASWKVIIKDKNDLEKFKEAMAIADENPISGHSGAVAEWSLVLYFINGDSTKFQASVHRYEMQHLFLEEITYCETKKGSYNIKSKGVCCLPNIGEWILKLAPKGTIANN